VQGLRKGGNSDNDGVIDSEDAFPLESNDTIDSGSDSIGNNLNTFPLIILYCITFSPK